MQTMGGGRAARSVCKQYDNENINNGNITVGGTGNINKCNISNCTILNARIDNQSFDLSIGENMNFQSSFSFKIFETDGMRISGAARLL